jgi:predicted metal-dependent RNase
MTVFKIDVDIRIPDSWMKKWKATRVAILKELGFKAKIRDIITTDSSLRGFHAYISAKTSKLTPTECNMIQFLLGDDTSRVLINQRRIARKVDWQTANKLFTKVLWRKKEKFNCKTMKKIWEKEKKEREEGRNEMMELLAREKGWK